MAAGVINRESSWLQIVETSSSSADAGSPTDSKLVVRRNAADGQSGLFSRDGSESSGSKLYVIGLLSFVMFGYSLAMFVNASSTRMMVARTGSTSAILPWLLASVLDPLYVIGVTRALALALLLVVLAPRHGTSFPALLFEPAGGSDASPVGSGNMRMPLASGICNALGYGFYLTLVRLDGVAVWSAMIGLYAVAPCIYFMLSRGESASKRKIFGVLACCSAAFLLGMGKGEGSANPLAGALDAGSPLWLKLTLLLAVIAFWGLADTFQALASQQSSSLFVAGWAGTGFGLMGLVSLSLGWLVSVIAVDEMAPAYAPKSLCVDGVLISSIDANSTWAGLPCAPPVSQRLGGIVLIAVAQAVAMCSWYGICKLSAMSEASSFLPIISLYTMVTSLASVALLGETLNSLGWAGMAVGACGILLVGAA